MPESERNARLAKENSVLKATITANEDEMAAMLKRSIKAEYYIHIAYKEAVDSVSYGMTCVEECLDVCRRVKESIERQYARISVPGRERVLQAKNAQSSPSAPKGRPHTWAYQAGRTGQGAGQENEGGQEGSPGDGRGSSPAATRQAGGTAPPYGRRAGVASIRASRRVGTARGFGGPGDASAVESDDRAGAGASASARGKQAEEAATEADRKKPRITVKRRGSGAEEGAAASMNGTEKGRPRRRYFDPKRDKCGTQ